MHGFHSLLLAGLCLASTVLAASDFEQKEKDIVARYLELSKNATFEKLYKETFEIGRPRQKHIPFNCTVIPRSAGVPTSVHRLRPGDVKVVAAMGDSLTAGRGAQLGIVGLLLDFRGSSWSIGGNSGKFWKSDLNTLPNILRHYNPDIYGFATGSGNRDASNSHLSVARSGDESKHMLQQAVMLTQRMKNDPNVDFENDWKVITLFIGGNDLCDYCTDKEEFSAEMYKANIRAALDYLHENVPRAFVNLVEVLNVEMASEVAKGLVCHAVHLFVCDCASNPKSSAAREELIALKQAYRDATQELATSGRYDTKDDFTVVLQPFYRDTQVPRKSNGKVDYSFFAADCFHHSEKGQQAAGEALWNNMVEPVGEKRTEWAAGEPLECPTQARPYFYTYKNSGNNY